jgi:hypothetical protein
MDAVRPDILTTLRGLTEDPFYMSKAFATKDDEVSFARILALAIKGATPVGEPDYDSVPVEPRRPCGSDTDFELDPWGCIVIWNCDHPAPIRISLRELHAVHQQVFKEWHGSL